MRSLSLESILVNKNMKLLILLVTLLVQTNPSLSMPTPDLELIFSEILQSLEELKAVSQHDLKPFNHSVQIQIPHDIENACECEAAFVQHLKAALKSVNGVLHVNETEDTKDLIENILDNLNSPHVHNKIKKSNGSCTFTKHVIKHTALSNVFKKNAEFIQNWNSHCRRETKPKRN